MRASGLRGTSPRLPVAALAAALLSSCGGGGTSPPACDLPPEVTVGTTEAYRLIGPADWPAGCTTLTVHAPALASTERLGLVLVNAGGPDNATPSITVSGTTAFAAADAAPVAAQARAPADALAVSLAGGLAEGQALVLDRRRATLEAWLAAGAPRQAASAAAAAAPVIGDTWKDPRGPCVHSFSTSTTTRQPATLRHITLDAAGTTPVALFFVTDAVWTSFQRVLSARPDLWTSLDSYLKGTVDATRNPTGAKRVLPALHESFGTESDVDGNGALIFLFADLGRTGSGGFTVGYFDGTDASYPADTTADCSGTANFSRFDAGSNGADMLYLLDPCTLYKDGFNPVATSCPTSGSGTGSFPYSVSLDELTPGVMAHELQHDVIFNTRCLRSSLPSCRALADPAGDLWLNEGLSMVSEDTAGFGLHTPAERSTVGVYLDCVRTSSDLCYQDVSLTTWPATGQGNATGHYGGSHAFVRWSADQADAGRTPLASGSALTRALVASPSPSRAAVAAATGLSFEEAYARFSTGAMFSGEDALFLGYAGPLRPSPDFAFAAGVPWSPLHAAVGRVKYAKLQPGASLVTTLHNDGWGAYLSGLGTGAEVTLTIASTAGVKPRAAVVRLQGNLPL